ncbi:MAG: hypothetical protein K9G61_04285 [Bacteroidales bacterium]|nr:hypothetical protein [Bacteroidales bacterium]
MMILEGEFHFDIRKSLIGVRRSKKDKEIKTNQYPMKKIFSIFSLLLFVSSWSVAQQQTPEDWLTPYANAAFKDGKIAYSVSNVQQSMEIRLLPVMYPRDLVRLSMDQRHTPVNGKYIGESQAKIRDYLATEPVSLYNAEKQNEYLRLAAMVLLWDRDLPKYCVDEIKKIKTTKSPELKANAATVLAVWEVFQENKVKR